MTRSDQLWQEARSLIPGGVNSPVRAFGAVHGTPVFMASGSGCTITDVDGKDYADYVMSWGALIQGHAHPAVVAAAREACGKGMTFGMPTEAENRLAARIVECVPSVEKVRMVSSGTEAVMSAIRLARGYTGRDLIVKFQGCYHGHSDGLLAAAGSGVATFSIPGTPGVPASYVEKTIVAPYNDEQAVQEVFRRMGDRIAAVIVEPVAGNMGVVVPNANYLKALRKVTAEYGALLIFDEVITGFRIGLAGAQGLFGVMPDLTTLGKIIGGGMPAAAYGGKAEIMERLAPEGPVYQAGTLSGNPVAMATGLALIEMLVKDPPYERLAALAARLRDGVGKAAAAAGVPVQQNGIASMQTTFFTETPVTDFATASTSDTERYAAFFHGMLARGIHLAPSQFEAAFVSMAHSEDVIDRTVSAATEVLAGLAG